MHDHDASPAVPVRPVIDDELVGSLERLMGREEVVELLADGMIDVLDMIGQLPGQLAEDDLPALAFMAHSLAGAAGNLGLARLSAAAADLERALREPNPVGVPDLVQTVVDGGDPALDALAAYVRPSEPDAFAAALRRARA